MLNILSKITNFATRISFNYHALCIFCSLSLFLMEAFFQFKKFRIWHDQCALKTNTDGVLLGAWACNILKNQPISFINEPSTKILDVGTGSGLISIMMAQETKSENIIGIDIDTPSVKQAKKNIEESSYSERIKVYQMDFTGVNNTTFSPIKSFNIIISNPPFYEEETKCHNNRANTAKHTTNLSFNQLINGVNNLLDNDGIFFVIIPYSSALTFIASCAENCLYLTHRCDVFTTAKMYETNTAQRVLLSFTRDIRQTEVQQLIIKEKSGENTSEFKKITENFYL